jgi:MFS family permease
VTRQRSAWSLVALLWVVALLNYVDRQVVFSVLPLLQKDLKLSALELGLLSTVFLWVYGILSPFAGYLADRFGRVRIILASLLVWSAVTWLTGHAQNLEQLLWARGLMGISEACYLPAALALIVDRHGERSKSLATGLHQSGLYCGMILGGAGGGWAGEHYGWRPIFTVLGAAGIIYFGVLWLTLSRQKATTRGESPAFLGAVSELLRTRGFIVVTLVFTIVSISNWLVYTWLPMYLYEGFHMTLAQAGFSATFYIQAASFGGILVGGWMADSWIRTTSRGRLLTQIVGLAAAAPFLFLIGFTRSGAVMIMALVLFGLGRGLYDANTMPVLSQLARSEVRSTGYGIFNLSSCLAGGAAAAMAGYFKTRIGLGGAFEISGVLLLISVWMLSRVAIPKATPDERYINA